MASETLAAWLLTVAVHATVLLGLAWLADRGALRSRPAWRETLWRAAFFGAVVTASVQVLLQAPTHARIALATRAHEALATDTTPVIVSTSTGTPATASSDNAPVLAQAKPSDTAPASHEARTESIVVATSAWHDMLATKLPPWHLILIAAWLAGALIALARLGAAWLRLERSLAHAEPVANASLATDVAALAIHARIESPALSALDDLTSPIAVTGRRILLPTWAVELLDRDQLRAMLAHETAHIARGDPEWKLAIAAWCALFWFVPLARLARKRLDEVAEISCDAWAAIHLGDGRSLAECLAECAERRVGGSGIELAPAMASRESPLLRRIDYLIAGVPMNTDSAGARAGFAAAAALAIAALVLPGVSLQPASAQGAPPAPPAPPAAPAPPAPPATAPGTHIHISSDSDGKHDMTIVSVSDDHHNYNVKIDGKITFTDAEDDVATLSSGGSAAFSEKHDGTARRVEIANRGGKLERRYFVDDKEQPFDAAAHAWMSTLIPTVIRETAIDADGRVKRIRAKGGANAVLDEIARIDSGYARGVYIKALAANGKLSPDEMTRALKLVDGIDGDYEKRNALVALVALGALQPFDAGQQKLVLAQADKIGSDYERAELLVGLLPHLAKDADVRAAWLEAALGIKSDYEHRRALTAMLEAGVDDQKTLQTVIDAAESIGSDYERRELLVAAVKRTRDAEALAPAYATAAGKIGSDYERREALMSLIRAPGFGKAGSRAVLDALANANAGYDCREVLVALARVMPNDPELIEKYRAVARRLGDYDRGEAERALDRFAAR